MQVASESGIVEQVQKLRGPILGLDRRDASSGNGCLVQQSSNQGGQRTTRWLEGRTSIPISIAAVSTDLNTGQDYFPAPPRLDLASFGNDLVGASTHRMAAG